MLGRVMLGVIRFYQRGVSPFFPPSCRFTPTCSEYAAQAVGRHGSVRGGWMAVRRILRCRPFGGWGPDPVAGVEFADAHRRRSDG